MFKKVRELDDLKDKKLFIELVSIYLKLIENFAYEKKLEFDYENFEITTNTSIRLTDIGVLGKDTSQDYVILKKLLKDKLYFAFLSAVNFNILHKNKIGSLLDKIDPSRRKYLQQIEKKNKKYKIIDLFCGAGGLSLGFIQQGFQVELANDNEDVCINTYRYNHPEIPDDKIFLGDISELIESLDIYSNKDIDVLIGGPPCQGFSSANQQRIIDDPRNQLYKYFIKTVELISPKFIIMENVRGMLPYAKQVVEDFENIQATKNKKEYNYNLAYKVLVSDDFGVAQKRPRLIFIGVRNDIVKSKKIESNDIFNAIEKENLNKKRHVLKDALAYIKELKAPKIKNMTEVDDNVTGKKIDVNQFKGNENSYLKIINGNRKINFSFNHKARYVNEINYEIYATLRQGEDGTNHKIKHIMPYKHRNHIFKDKYYKLIENKPSRTITAHLKMDCHSHIHPRQVRSITPREAARIQSFPDDYLFLGAYLKTYMQIGNAVPPLMAKSIAKVIKTYLR